MTRYFVSLAAVGVLAGYGVGADLKSGLEPGKSVPVFHPLMVTGPSAGEKQCPVWANGDKPVSLVFAREVTPALTSLVKQLDAAVQADSRLGAVVIFLSDDSKTEARLKELAQKEKLKRVVFAVESPSGPSSYNIAKDADVTVLLYETKKVKKNFAFGKGKMTEKDADTVAAAVKELLPAK